MHVAVLLIFEFFFGGDAHAALATAQKPTEGFWRVLGFHRVTAFDNDLLYFVEQPLFYKRRVATLVHFTAVCKEADVKCVGQNKFYAVFVKMEAAKTPHAIFIHKIGNILEPRIAFGVEQKGGANDLGFLAVNDDSLCPHII